MTRLCELTRRALNIDNSFSKNVLRNLNINITLEDRKDNQASYEGKKKITFPYFFPVSFAFVPLGIIASV